MRDRHNRRRSDWLTATSPSGPETFSAMTVGRSSSSGRMLPACQTSLPLFWVNELNSLRRIPAAIYKTLHLFPLFFFSSCPFFSLKLLVVSQPSRTAPPHSIDCRLELNVVTMMATRQLMGATRSRALGSASLGLRRMATVSDSPLDKKVCKTPC